MLFRYTSHSHVIHMLFTCYSHAIRMSFTCYSHVIHMSFTCYSHVNHMLFTCYSHVIRMLFTFHSHVIRMLFTCHSHVIHMLFTCVFSNLRWWHLTLGKAGPRPAATPAPATSVSSLRQVLRSHCGDAWAAQLLSQLRRQERCGDGVDANALQSALRCGWSWCWKYREKSWKGSRIFNEYFIEYVEEVLHEPMNQCQTVVPTGFERIPMSPDRLAWPFSTSPAMIIPSLWKNDGFWWFETIWNRLKVSFFGSPSQIIPLIRFSTRWPGHLLFPATAKLQSATPYARQAETHAACPALKMWLRPSMEISLVQGEKNEGRNRFWRTSMGHRISDSWY